MGRGPAEMFWDVLWKRDGVKLKNLRVGPKALQALLHNCASPMKAHCKIERETDGKKAVQAGITACCL